MINHIDLNAITLADMLNSFTNTIYSAVDHYLSTKISPVGVTGATVEKPLTTEEACEFLQVSEPILRQLAESGAITRHKFKGCRGYYYFASELVQDLKGQRRIY